MKRVLLFLALFCTPALVPACSPPPDPVVEIHQALGEDVGFEACGTSREPAQGEVLLFSGENFGGTCLRLRLYTQGNPGQVGRPTLGSIADFGHSAKAWVTNFCDFYNQAFYNTIIYGCSANCQHLEWGWDRIAPWEIPQRQFAIPAFQGVQGSNANPPGHWAVSSLYCSSP